MSYDIFYDKQFVKVNENTFIPMVLAGSNNCTEWSPRGRERRSRSWFNFAYLLNGSVAGSLDEMLKIQAGVKQGLIDSNGDEYSDKSFGYFTGLSAGGGCKMTYGQYLGIAKTGCAKALTVEQLRQENITISIFTSRYEKEGKLAEAGLKELSFTPNSTEELEAFLSTEAPKYAGVTTLQVTFHGMYESTMKWIRRRHFSKPKPQHEIIKSPVGYAIEIYKDGSQYGYLYSFKGGSFRFTQDETNAKQFLEEKEAERTAKKMKSRRGEGYDFKPVLVEYGYDKPFKVLAGKNITLPQKPEEKTMTDEELINSLAIGEESEEVVNMFDSTKKCVLEPLAVALHDFIKGCEITNKKPDLMQQALRMFREKYPEEYYVLLD